MIQREKGMNKHQYLAYVFGADCNAEQHKLVRCKTVVLWEHLERLAQEFHCTEEDAMQIAMQALTVVASLSPGLLCNLATLYRSDTLLKFEEQALLGHIVASIVQKRG
jgi:hypothetical protein